MLIDKIKADTIQSMKDKDANKTSTLRMLTSAVQYEALNSGEKKEEVNDETVVTVVQREIKKRKEAIGLYSKGGRDDLVAQEKSEIAIIEQYLPKQLSEDEVAELVKQAITETGATSARDMGAVMKAIMPKLKGKADGGLVNRLVREYLS